MEPLEVKIQHERMLQDSQLHLQYNTPVAIQDARLY